MYELFVDMWMQARHDLYAGQQKAQATYRLEALLGGLMDELIGDSQVAPSTQTVGP